MSAAATLSTWRAPRARCGRGRRTCRSSAAALPEAVATNWAALYDQGRLAPGETLLIHGEASGIGATAIMMARSLGAGRIFVTAGAGEKCRACEALGAGRAINYRTEDFVEVVRAETGGRGVDVVLDMVAGDYVPRNLDVLDADGRLVMLGTMGACSRRTSGRCR